MLVKMLLTFIITLVLFQQMEGSLDRYTFPTRLFKYKNLLQRNKFRRSEKVLQSPETVYLTVYYESFCEDSRDFFTKQLMAAYEMLEPYLNVRLVPYGKATTLITDSPEYYSFTCQHGPGECYGNKLHACTLDTLPSQHSANVFITCLMDYAQTDNGSDDNALKKCGYALSQDVKGIQQCARNKSGNFLLNYYGERSKMTKYKYVPHILLNGVRNNGTSLIADICATLKNPPPECKIFYKQN